MLKTFYHWSPTDRRERILAEGLLPHQPSTDEVWNPPHICLTDSAYLAWALSGNTARGRLIGSWDLWEVMLLRHQYRHHEQEIRVASPIDRKFIVYVGTRVQSIQTT